MNRQTFFIGIGIICTIAVSVYILKQGTYPTQKDYEIIEVLSDACTTDTDCATPMDYAVRSICPYTSLCIESRCTVVCPHPFTGKPSL